MRTKKTTQILIITAAIAAVIIIYKYGKTLPVNTIAAQVESTSNQQDQQHQADVDEYEKNIIALLDEVEQQKWQSIDTENQAKQASDFLHSIDQNGLASLYAFKYAEHQPSADAWNYSGNLAVRAFRESNDTSLSTIFIENAVSSYRNSLVEQPVAETKLKLALLYTQVTGEIMPGVALLQEIVKEEPNHIQANYELALLSIQSGQDDKAIDRFNTIILTKPDFIEPYIYKAQLLLKNNQKVEALKTVDQAIAYTSNQEGLMLLNELKKNIENN